MSLFNLLTEVIGVFVFGWLFVLIFKPIVKLLIQVTIVIVDGIGDIERNS